MKPKRSLFVSLALISVLGGSSLPVHAGGPLDICRSGQPFVWPNQGSNIPFNPDQGTLGPLSNEQAVMDVSIAFQVWADVASSTATYQNAGPLPVDVDITNFVPFLLPLAPDGFSAIVFDSTGDIFNLLFGEESGILGFAGPEWLDDATCQIDEGVSFLNGPEFTDSVVAQDVMVHEFGHYSNLAHTVVNGQVILTNFFGVGNDMPSPDPNFPALPPNPFADIIETMYPFYYGALVGTRTVEADDIAALSTLYPENAFSSDFGSISGTIFGPNASTKLTGVNVIARNVNFPYADAVSAISSDFTDGLDQSDPNVGTYTINGLTPNAQYVVFVDEIFAGGFSTPLNSPPPGPEEFYNGASESNDPSTDDPTDAEVIMALAGSPVGDVDVVFNQRVPGEPLPVPDEGGVQLFLPFKMRMCGETYENVFINGNGYVSFGALGPNPSFIPNIGEFLSGPPKIAPLWADLDASSGGVVTFEQTRHTFSVIYEDVPEFFFGGANSFKVTIFRGPRRRGNSFLVTYGGMTAPFGIAGFSCGGATTSGFETETDLSETRRFFGFNIIRGKKKTAVFEEFDNFDNDLADLRLFYTTTSDFRDRFEPNDSIRKATRIHLPFDTISDKRFTEIEPAGDDVDYFKFRAQAGDILTAEILTGQIDSAMGLYQIIEHHRRRDHDSDSSDSSSSDSDSSDSSDKKNGGARGVLIAVDDDGGVGLLSKIVFEIPADGHYAIAVSTFPDFDFNGDGNNDPVFGRGRYVLSIGKE